MSIDTEQVKGLLREGSSPPRHEQETTLPTSPTVPTAAEVMTRHPATVDAQTSLFNAWGRLHGDKHRYLVVIDDKVRPIGVIEERDIALEWPSGPLGAHHLAVHQLLRFRSTPRVRATDRIDRIASTMLDERAEAVAVVDGSDRLVGLVTVWHCVEFAAASSS